MPVDDADHADALRIGLVVDRIRKPAHEHSTEETMSDGRLLRCFADLIDGDVEFGEEVSRGDL